METDFDFVIKNYTPSFMAQAALHALLNFALGKICHVPVCVSCGIMLVFRRMK